MVSSACPCSCAGNSASISKAIVFGFAPRAESQFDAAAGLAYAGPDCRLAPKLIAKQSLGASAAPRPVKLRRPNLNVGNRIRVDATLTRFYLTERRIMATKKPNIVIIWGDDIGLTNVSAYSDGLMGYSTPNIDRIASEGVRFTDSYAEQSCTAGRSSFITGQCGFRPGNTKVGMPGAAQ